MVTITVQNQEIICAFAGRLDTMALMKDEMAVSGRLEQAAGHRVVFDLAGVGFIASSFLRLCLSTAKKLGAGRFAVRGASPEIKKVFAISGLDKQLTVT